jgi:hypothetical protein
MGIILRNNKGSELTYNEVDNNFQSLYYSSSLNNNSLNFYFPSSSNSHSINIEGIVSQWTGSNPISAYDNVVITGSLSNGINIYPSTASYFHAEGNATLAAGNYSHAEGIGTTTYGLGSHAEGGGTQANGINSHAEGNNTISHGTNSHTEGTSTITYGTGSHAEGYHTIAKGDFSHVQGKYNISSSIPAAFIVGNGTDNNNRNNLIFAGNDSVVIDSNYLQQNPTSSIYQFNGDYKDISILGGFLDPNSNYYVNGAIFQSSSIEITSGVSTIISSSGNQYLTSLLNLINLNNFEQSQIANVFTNNGGYESTYNKMEYISFLHPLLWNYVKTSIDGIKIHSSDQNGNTISINTSSSLVNIGNPGASEITMTIQNNGYIILSTVSSSLNFADDSSAGGGGVPLGGLYHTSGSLKIRLV